MLDFSSIFENLEFVNVSTENSTIFEWKPAGSFKSFVLDLNIYKKNAIKDIFFHINKGNLKIAYIRKDNLIYSAGSKNQMQYQMLEALIEQVIKDFNEMYAVDVILSYENFSPNVFNNFKSKVEEIIENFNELNIVRIINVPCMVCNQVLPLVVKRSFILSADSYPVPLVYTHKGHTILCFIDKNFDVRGVELVNITG
ncbi:MAG: hypothetical protein ACTSW3_02595 [Promethearchaeota archaeon]